MGLFRLRTLLLMLVLICSRAGAEETDATAAEALFKKGTLLFQTKDYTGAAKSFREAYQIRPTWKLHYNIAQCEASAKHHGRALEAFEAYLSEGGDDVSGDRSKAVMAEIESLRKMVGMLNVQAPDGAVVYVGGDKRGTVPLPGPIPVAASVRQTVRVEFEGHEPDERVVKVMGQQVMTVNFKDLQETTTASPPPPIENTAVSEAQDTPVGSGEAVRESSAAPTRRPPIRKWGFVTLGVGGALLVAGAVTGGLTLARDSELVDECQPSCPAERQSDVDTRDALATATDVLLPVGGAAAVAGILMITVFTKRAEKRAAQDVAVRPVSGGAIVRWSF